MASFSDSHVNIVNATLIAKEMGIVINETHARQSKDLTFSNLVTLKSIADGPHGGKTEQIIEGYAGSDKRVYISKLARFNATFNSEGTPGMVLGSHGISLMNSRRRWGSESAGHGWTEKSRGCFGRQSSAAVKGALTSMDLTWVRNVTGSGTKKIQ